MPQTCKYLEKKYASCLVTSKTLGTDGQVYANTYC